MRYYRIVITDAASGKVSTPPGFDGLLDGATYTSYANGRNLAEAWDVELDVPVIGQATPQGFALCRVWGISVQEIGQANDLINKNISIFAGMQKGLPLANPQQSGLIVQGYIFQAFGNWIDTDMTLDLVIGVGSGSTGQKPGVGSLAQPRNIALDWRAGTTLGDALKNALSVAFPSSKDKITVATSPNLVRSNDEIHIAPTLEQLAQYARATSIDVIGKDNYIGVDIIFQGDTITVSDGTIESSVPDKAIAFQDLIGQPTWIQSPLISLKTVMRADLSIWQKITLPALQTINSAQALSSIVNQRAAFQGGFRVRNMRHVGRFRQPTADAWVTVIEGAPEVVTKNG